MKEIYKSEVKTRKEIFESVPKEVIEKQFILNFFKELPVEKIKDLINFQEIDFENEKNWQDAWGYESKIDELHRLRVENVVKYKCETKL